MNYDTHIPIPEQSGSKYKLDGMPVGASKFFAGEPAIIHSRVTLNAAKLGYKIVTRVLTEDDTLGVRVWRSE